MIKGVIFNFSLFLSLAIKCYFVCSRKDIVKLAIIISYRELMAFYVLRKKRVSPVYLRMRLLYYRC